ncbi:hypothetical protein [Pollutibacter soli]|uniref:hypothetical protein n=1 Tax=Pollutibacter soli TaxID=3034157 RepID=UPI0030139DF8
MSQLLNKIISKLSKEKFIDQIADEISGTEFNSLMLEIFRRRAESVSPAAVLKAFEENRFVRPSGADAIETRQVELEWLESAREKSFQPMVLSPLTPLGTCTAFGAVSQNKIISSLRGTEVVSDATNVLLLHMASVFKNNNDRCLQLNYSTIHRMVRAQQFSNPEFSAHFSLFSLVSGGYDEGAFQFELDQLNRHISLYLEMIKRYLPGKKLQLKFFLKTEDQNFNSLLSLSTNVWSNMECSIVPPDANRYYQRVQFKIYIEHKGMQVDIADGGFVDWLQATTGNRKLKAMISAAGIELIQKFISKKQQ